MKKYIGTLLVYAFLLTIVLIMLIPFYWMTVLSTHSTHDIMQYPPPFWFGNHLKANLQSMMDSVNIFRSFLNSIVVSGGYTLLVLFFCSIGGYAFAMYRFPGRNKLFAVLIITMMIPWTAGIIPWFFMMSKFGWINSFWALIIPNSANAFGIFWMRQYCQNNVPGSLIDAAKIDGLSEWLIFFKIIAPILMPGVAALGIMMFVNSWNDFMQPMLILRDRSMHTLPIMLKYMLGDPSRGSDTGALIAASTLAILPILIAFLMASRFFMSGLTAGAVKE
ncbi:carbohydrate ABC transporter permease [Oceanispirochaeta sp.]|jgi:ABC-type glycerol-3-phosphate transport system permease component|uniref:carbohydrate ABC transporter permease n=1 Tax=Oceanispirochaeta sp. TaxID=2035350 RepID=UPI0026116B47|nr:carbohydrate ABC transporter permease [Oceanispirochaeta sp.]MDA3956383.1 carbohydrate ABC transporter permease [Oceanispirochaeta sp.]